MNKTKNVRRLRAYLGSFLVMTNLMAAGITQAASTPVSFAPVNSHFIIELNTGKEHPFKNHLKEMFQDAANGAEHPEMLKLLVNNIENTDLVYSQIYRADDGSEINLLSVTVPEDLFQEAVGAATDLNTTDLGLGRKIYQSGEDFFFTYLEGNLVAASQKGLISDLLMQSQRPASILKNSEYQRFNSKANPESFLKTFLDLQAKPQNNDNYYAPVTPDWLKSEGLAFTQTLSGIEGQIIVNMSDDSPYQASQLTATPTLYQKINPQDLLFYSESFNWAARLKTLDNSINQATYTESVDPANFLRQALKEQGDLDLDQDLTPVFSQNTSLFIHGNPDQADLATFSLLSQSDANSSKQLIDKLIATLQTKLAEQAHFAYQSELNNRQYLEKYYPEELANQPALPTEEEFVKQFYTLSSETIDGVTYQRLVLHNPTASSSTGIENLFNKITISTGVLSDGSFFLTTNPNPSSELSNSGLNSDSEFKKNFQPGRYYDLSFVNLDNIEKYVVSLMEKYDGNTDISEFKKYFDPLQSFYNYSVITDNSVISNLKLNLDISKISVYQEIFQSFQSIGFPYGFEPTDDYSMTEWKDYLYDDAGFNDSQKGDWYYSYVNHVANSYIMTGDGNSFRPNEAINRAEFIKTVISALDYNGNYFTEVEPNQYFTDVASDAWYARYINRARAHGIIQGYQDNTFRPEQTITRAEAVEILHNALKENASYTINPNLDLPFYDVKPSDWFYQSVKGTFQNKLISGKSTTTFAPNQSLTRAETAAIISRYLDNFGLY